MPDRDYFQFLTYQWDVTTALTVAETLPEQQLATAPFRPFLSIVHVDQEHAARADLSRPVLVVTVGELDGSTMLIDGWHRLHLARTQGLTHPPCHVLNEEQELQARMFGGQKGRPRRNRPHRPASLCTWRHHALPPVIAGARIGITLEGTVQHTYQRGEITLADGSHVSYDPTRHQARILSDGWDPGDVIGTEHGALTRILQDGHPCWQRRGGHQIFHDDQINPERAVLLHRAEPLPLSRTSKALAHIRRRWTQHQSALIRALLAAPGEAHSPVKGSRCDHSRTAAEAHTNAFLVHTALSDAAAAREAQRVAGELGRRSCGPRRAPATGHGCPTR
ncbi:hypothetical protein [Streptomyces sp. NPDC059893]|uniref:hypothetical protein n=1 Tax=Streptomyces sp. NPDC059893 TaxID=3346990 RepID=UPI003660323C